MLIEVPYKVGDTVSFKLVSGEEIIGRLEAEDPNSYTLHKPMILLAQQEGIGLVPFMLSVSPDSKLVLKSTSVVCASKTQRELANHYTTQTTGIVT